MGVLRAAGAAFRVFVSRLFSCTDEPFSMDRHQQAMKRVLFVLSLVVAGMLWVKYSQSAKPPVNYGAAPAVAKAEAPPTAKAYLASSSPRSAPEPEPLTIFQRIARNDTNVAKLPIEQVEAYLSQNHSNVESLITAYNVTGDKAYLRQALADSPTNSLALASAILMGADPEKRPEWIAQLKSSAPENSLGDYLSARENFKSTNYQSALADLGNAQSKSVFQDYALERLQGLEEIYMNSGHSAAEAKALAMVNIHLPHLKEMRDVGRDLSALEARYAEAGDANSAQALARMGLNIADTLAQSGAYSMLSQAVGIAIQKDLLRPLDPNQSYDFLPGPVKEQLTQLDAQKKELQSLGATFDQWIQVASEPQLVSYFDRMKLHGEAEALRWARTQAANR